MLTRYQIHDFSHSVGCLFIVLMGSFPLQNLFSFTQFHLFIFAFVAFGFAVRSKKKNIAETDVKELSTSIFSQDFYGFRSYIIDFSLF